MISELCYYFLCTAANQFSNIVILNNASFHGTDVPSLSLIMVPFRFPRVPWGGIASPRGTTNTDNIRGQLAPGHQMGRREENVPHGDEDSSAEGRRGISGSGDRVLCDI